MLNFTYVQKYQKIHKTLTENSLTAVRE